MSGFQMVRNPSPPIWCTFWIDACAIGTPVPRLAPAQPSNAIAKSMPALVSVELKRLTLARKDLPTDWDAVLRLLADPEGLRNYRE